MFSRRKRRSSNTEWLWWLLFFMTTGCELVASNPDVTRYMTDDLVATPPPASGPAVGGSGWWKPYLLHIRAAEQRPERICRYWHAAHAAWRFECGGSHPDLPDVVQRITTPQNNWSLYVSGVQTECSPDWAELSWREVEGIGACAELLLAADCDEKPAILERCEAQQWPRSSDAIRPI